LDSYLPAVTIQRSQLPEIYLRDHLTGTTNLPIRIVIKYATSRLVLLEIVPESSNL